MSTLQSERSKALSCFERALFYADVVPKPEDMADLYRLPPTENQYSKNITAIYALAGVVLSERRYLVTVLYSNARDELQREVIPDRGKRAIFESGEHVWKQFKDIIDEAFSRDATVALVDLCDNWQGLNNICRLFMDEITHLSQRINNFNDARKTLSSIRYAIWGVGVTAAITLLSIFVSIILANPNKQDDLDKNSITAYIEAGKLSEKDAHESKAIETSDSNVSTGDQK